MVSIAAESVAPMYRDVCATLEDTFQSVFSGLDFGGNVREFIVAIVAVEEDPDANNKFCAPSNKVGRYKDWRTHESVKFISIALSFDPVRIERMTKVQVVKDFCNALIIRLENIGVKIPSGFKYLEFVSKLRVTLETFEQTLDDNASL